MFGMNKKVVRYLVFGVLICLVLFLILHKWSIPTSLNEHRNEPPETLELSTEDKVESQSQINERLIRPLKGASFSPVITQFLKGQGKAPPEPRIQMLAASLVNKRDTLLTFKEQEMVRDCVRTASVDRSRSTPKFFGGKTQEIRRTHHTYLNENSLLMEIGGNWGWDAGNFSKLYNPRYIILEPLQEYVNILEKKFENKTNVNIYNLGLGARNETIMVNMEGNNACATSKFSGKRGNVPIHIIEAKSFMTGLGVGTFDVDLLTMNCEGCEFEALENLLSFNIIEKFKNIQWGTHSLLKGMKDPIGRYCRITALLSRTHRPTYQYKFNWESWRRKDIV
ncbi:uncharacterized protein LOC110446904 [Mizuhopecten yessoensis]|uniref:Methyltransferase FkbM domain-containing protein n=1 Tax=Mizuhopecten yessoensis TaxID=6573 RepID=A0A210QWB7_MIZYE|nr:uncharacterized protein LOC110446904 [Mizuhopecten yessoensis]XP_021347922.1 uncharacterized protein LOC110446904 [Mizuhopecten yessoensis]OWF53059.1 hypothetical protein KP79_PYT24083 [Mizuhopecten yessoensis]